MRAQTLRDRGIEFDAATGEHQSHKLDDLDIHENGQRNIVEIVDEIDQAESIQRTGEIDGTPDEPARVVFAGVRVLALGAEPGQELAQQRGILPLEIEQHVR